MNKFLPPRVYDRSETDFGHMGLGVLKDAISCESYEEDNGEFTLTLKYPVSGNKSQHLKGENIIKAWASEELGEQLFRIVGVEKVIKGIMTIKANHITYDLQENFVENVAVIAQTCDYAIKELFRVCAYNHPFTGSSNIENPNNFGLERVNPYEAIKGTKGSLCDTYGNGPKVIRDNFHISVNKSRGENRGVLIAYGKNLTGFTSNDDWYEVVTCIYPFAKFTDPDTHEEKILTLPEKYVYSPYKDNYRNLKILPMDFSNHEVSNADQLRKVTEDYFKTSKCDIPKVNYKVNFVLLSQTEQYKNYKLLEKVQMGDTVMVRDYRFNLDITAEVIKTKHCSLTHKMISCELGNFKFSLTNIMNDLEKNQEQIQNRVNKIKVTMDQELGEMKMTFEDTSKGLQNQITANTNELKVKISAGEANSIIQQNPGSVQIGFNGINDVIRMIPEGMRVNHGNNYSLLSGNGIMRYNGSTQREYHYLTHVVGATCSGDPNSDISVQLPDEFRNTDFRAYATLSDTWESSWDYGEPWVLQRMVAYVSGYDRANARISVKGYRVDKNYSTGGYRRKPIACMIIVIV